MSWVSRSAWGAARRPATRERRSLVRTQQGDPTFWGQISVEDGSLTQSYKLVDEEGCSGPSRQRLAPGHPPAAPMQAP